jgi:hypothetical protein
MMSLSSQQQDINAVRAGEAIPSLNGPEAAKSLFSRNLL